ncbi:MAG: toll/interleukin-1 receptor domain-containing protein [Clostridia bacterium]|nr:toll/interleukin-1 receptor domain-containing protein [Clostridia bacterium]
MASKRIRELNDVAEQIIRAAEEVRKLAHSLEAGTPPHRLGGFYCIPSTVQDTLQRFDKIRSEASGLQCSLSANAEPLFLYAADKRFDDAVCRLHQELEAFEKQLSIASDYLSAMQKESESAPICSSTGHGTAERKQDKTVSPKLKDIQFSVVAPKRTQKGTYLLFSIYMYEDAYRSVVDEALGSGAKKQEHRSGVFSVADETYVRITVDSPDLHESETEAMYWKGKYLRFDFAPSLPEDFRKDRVLFAASVYFNGILATKLIFDAAVGTGSAGRLRVGRNDIRSAFISYASEDLAIVANALQGMKKVRPDLDVFFDRDSLRSGDLWERVIKNEIDSRDMLYLFWSRNARNSEWVDMEWRYALKNRGVDFIDPFPIESPDVCPPPEELNMKHFNDREILYYRGSRPTEP